MAFILVQHLDPPTRACWSNCWPPYGHDRGQAAEGMADRARPPLHHPAGSLPVRPRRRPARLAPTRPGTARDCRSTSCCSRWPRTTGRARSAWCCRGQGRTAARGCGPSRQAGGRVIVQDPRRPATTACREAPSRPALWTPCCRSRRDAGRTVRDGHPARPPAQDRVGRSAHARRRPIS